MAARKSTVVESVAGTIKPPISFKEFSKDPVKGLLFIVLIAIGYLYVDIKMSNKEIQTKQDATIQRYAAKVDTLQNQVNILIQQAASSQAKMEVLESLKQIPK
jgi:archaellum component FlaF (FlaF/FlaG flagellin family)